MIWLALGWATCAGRLVSSSQPASQQTGPSGATKKATSVSSSRLLSVRPQVLHHQLLFSRLASGVREEVFALPAPKHSHSHSRSHSHSHSQLLKQPKATTSRVAPLGQAESAWLGSQVGEKMKNRDRFLLLFSAQRAHKSRKRQKSN